MDRCQACRDRRHGPACAGCDCPCRGALSLDLFPGGDDPTAPGSDDQAGQVA